ncbi:FUSC family protein [Streptomyces diastatochromogenes]|nr:FUSC family protein [Streptomyces diastatochromogenes]
MYAAVLPVWMLVAFTVGPVKGVGWAQGLFTVLVALVFAQLAPPTWRLAEVRMLDVLVGSAIGAVFGLLAWPAEPTTSCAARRPAAAQGRRDRGGDQRLGGGGRGAGHTVRGDRPPVPAARGHPRGVRVRAVPERADALRRAAPRWRCPKWTGRRR